MVYYEDERSSFLPPIGFESNCPGTSEALAQILVLVSFYSEHDKVMGSWFKTPSPCLSLSLSPSLTYTPVFFLNISSPSSSSHPPLSPLPSHFQLPLMETWNIPMKTTYKLHVNSSNGSLFHPTWSNLSSLFPDLRQPRGRADWSERACARDMPSARAHTRRS